MFVRRICMVIDWLLYCPVNSYLSILSSWRIVAQLYTRHAMKMKTVVESRVRKIDKVTASNWHPVGVQLKQRWWLIHPWDIQTQCNSIELVSHDRHFLALNTKNKEAPRISNPWCQYESVHHPWIPWKTLTPVACEQWPAQIKQCGPIDLRESPNRL